MELFAFTVFYDVDGNMIIGEEAIQAAYEDGQRLIAPRMNFNNIGYSMVTVFTVIMGEDWNIIANMY